MSEFLAEARILVRPDTTKFRAELEAALATSIKPISIPVVPVVAGGLNAATASTEAFTTAQVGAAAQTQAVAAAMEKETIAATELTAATAASNRAQAQGLKGVVAQGASLLGLRAGTLAASSAFIAGTVAVLGFAKAVQSAAQFETELNVFRVTTKATADEFARAGDEAKQLGRDITLPGVTAGDAAVAMTELAKAGLSVEDSMNGARGALQLATAAQIDNVTATKLVAGALNSFQLSGNEAVKVADLLTGAANESQGEIADMGTALGQASAVAHLFGVSVEDTVTLLTELAKAGISGGRAGTSLRVAFLRLVNPPAAAAKALKELNVQIRDSQGNLRPEIFSDITKALQGYTKAQQQARLATIFGSDAIRAAAIIGAQGADGFNQVSEAINEFGLAQQQAAARTSGLQGSAENLKNQFSSLGLSIGEVAKGPLTAFVNETALVVGSMADGVSAATKFGGAIKGLGSDVAGAIPFMDKLITSVKLFDEAILLGPLGVAKFGADIGHAFGLGAEKVKADAADIRAEILKIVKAGQQTGGDLGLNQTLVALDALVAKLNKGGPGAQKFASEIAAIRTELQKTGTTGFKIFPDNVEDLFPQDLRSGSVAKKVGETNRDALEEALSGRDLFSFTKASFDNVTKAIVASGKEAESAARVAFAAVVKAATEELAKINEQVDVAVAGGSQQGQLAALRKRQAELQKERDAADAAAKEIGAGNKGFATAVAKRRQAQSELASTNEQIRGIEDQIASDAEKTAQDVITSRNKADQAILDSLSGRETDLQNRVLAAQATKSLKDDIVRNQALRAFYISAREQASKTLTDAKARLQAVRTFTKDIITITNTITDLQNEQIEAQKQARLERAANLVANASLDVDLAQITGNKQAEINARLKVIADLKKEQKLTQVGTIAYKQLRNDIAEQNKAIADLQAEKKKQNNALAQASFDFLQAQQGFASNLLGNLIPTGATGGLVGGGSVQQALPPLANAAEAATQTGPTAGQGNVTNHILNQILQQIKQLNGRTSAPEAQQWVPRQHSVMDGVGGG